MNNPFEVIEARLSNIESLLLDLKHRTKEHVNKLESDQWFDLPELCEYHPDKPSRATVYAWVHGSSIPYHKGTKKLRFLKSEIDLWLKTGKRKTISEINLEAGDFIKNRKGQ